MRGIPPVGMDWKVWARQMNAYLSSALVNLKWKSAEDRPSENGVILWDEVNAYPVISKNGEFKQIILEDGNYAGGISSNVTAAAANTAYALTYTASVANGINNDATNPERLVFVEAGEYLINFSAQIDSSSSSTVNFWFWPRVNGADVTGSTMRNSLHSNGSTLVVSRSAVFSMAAGDYLEAMWAVDSTSGQLTAHAATAFAPAAPSSTISITRIHG